MNELVGLAILGGIYALLVLVGLAWRGFATAARRLVRGRRLDVSRGHRADRPGPLVEGRRGRGARRRPPVTSRDESAPGQEGP